MEISYKRDPNVSHMIIDGVPAVSGYEDRMIGENDIPCLLKFSRAGTYGRYGYWYDISCKKSLKAYLLSEGITMNTVYNCLKSISDCVEILKRYLLHPESIIISPETIFIGEDGFVTRGFFAYVPGLQEDFEKGIQSIAEFLIENVDHDSTDIMQACYRIYEKISRGETSMDELLIEVKGINHEANKSYHAEEINKANGSLDSGRIKDNLEEQHSSNTMDYDNPSELMIINAIPNADEDLFSPIQKEPKRKRSRRKRREKEENNKQGILSLFKKDIKDKKKELFPSGEELEDFILDPVVSNAPVDNMATVLLNPGDNSLSRRLRYEGRGNHLDMDIDKTPFLIGSRRDGNDGVIEEGVVSRTHARIIIKEDEFFIEDLESRNGTFLNGQILDFNKQAKLNPGDRISFANVGYRFE